MTTLLGPVEIKEQLYQRGTRRVRPLCEAIVAKAGGYSRGVEEAVVDFGAEDSFALAAERLGRHHPVNLSASTVRKITLAHASRMSEQEDKNACLGRLPGKGPAYIIAEADGTMLPVVQTEGKHRNLRKNRKCHWKEMRLCAAKAAGKADAVYACENRSVEELGYRWSHCAGAAGWATSSHVHVVSDGAAWIGKQARQCFGSNCSHLLDLYHVSEYLAAAQRANPSWKEPSNWLEKQKNRLLAGKAHEIIEELMPHLESSHADDADAPIRAAWRYLSNHIEQLNYPEAIKHALPLGSGLIEGGHRHVLQKRLKISGSWWNQENLQFMAQLRIRRANNG
ncbi:MAG: UPF0236 family protein, partial [Cyanobacteria bacterium P01_C01_bin.147]